MSISVCVLQSRPHLDVVGKTGKGAPASRADFDAPVLRHVARVRFPRVFLGRMTGGQLSVHGAEAGTARTTPTFIRSSWRWPPELRREKIGISGCATVQQKRGPLTRLPCCSGSRRSRGASRRRGARSRCSSGARGSRPSHHTQSVAAPR